MWERLRGMPRQVHSAKPTVEGLEPRVVLSVYAHADVNLADLGQSISSVTGPSTATAHGGSGIARATATVNSLSVNASDSDGLTNHALASASGKWTFTISGLPVVLKHVDITFTYQLLISNVATSTAGNHNSFSIAGVWDSVTAGTTTHAGHEIVFNQGGSKNTSLSSSVGYLTGGSITATFAASGIGVFTAGLTAQTVNTRGNASSNAAAVLQITGFSSPQASLSPGMSLKFSDGRTLIPNLDTPANVNNLAKILMSEASIANDAERNAVGWTVLNRMARDGTSNVIDVWNAYAHNQIPTPSMIDAAQALLDSTGLDPTDGATHYFSPRSYSTTALHIGPDGNVYDSNGIRQDVLFDANGHPVTEMTPGLPVPNYIPSWVPTMNPRTVAGARPSYYIFFHQPGTGRVH